MSETIEEKCLLKGVKLTDQRKVIAQVMSQSSDHPDVDELYNRVSKIDSKISIATVYRTVKLFEESGILAKHEFKGGKARYEELNEGHHDHLIDVKSGEIIEFVDEEIEKLPMLWIADKVSVPKLFVYVFIPSVVCMVVPIYIATFLKPFQGNVSGVDNDESNITKIGTTMLWLGLGGIIFVPIFKVLTGLPPYVGMMLSLAVVATFAEIFSGTKFNITTPNNDGVMHSQSPVHKALTQIELPSILFFLGILMAVAALESIGYLFEFAQYLETAIPDIRIVAGLLGLGSAVIDNVPLVAASIGMFSQPMDDSLWHLIAYSAGTGGSVLVIGSAAGVVAMGMEKIEFFWYLKKIGWLAFIGFAAGFITFVLMEAFILT